MTATDGVILRARHHRGRGRAAVILGHAMMVSSQSFERGGVPGLLAGRGFEVYNFDLRGHGRSACDGWSYDDFVLRDLPAMVSGVRARQPGLPVALVGHSLTGHASLAWLGQEAGAPVDAVVTVAANVWLRRLDPSRARWLQKRLVLEAWHTAARPFGRFPTRRLRLGSEDVALPYIRQFLTWARSDAWTSQDGRDYLTSLSRIRVPVLSVVGAADRFLCAPECGRAFAAYLKSAPLTLWEVARDEIPGLVPDHMRLVTDARAAPLWERVAGWLDGVLPGRPPS